MANAIVEQSGDTDSDDDLSKVGDDDHSPRRHAAALSSSASDPNGHKKKRKQVRGKCTSQPALTLCHHVRQDDHVALFSLCSARSSASSCLDSPNCSSI